MPSIAKGVIWLFLATIAEVTPVVSLAISLHRFFVLITLQVFISLDLNGKHFPSNLFMRSSPLNLILLQKPELFDIVRFFAPKDS